MMRRLSGHKNIVYFVAVTVVLVIVIGCFASCDSGNTPIENAGGAVSVPMQSAVSESSSWIGGIFEYFGSVKKLKSENEQLKNENTNLQKQIRDMEGLSSENGKLRQMLNLKNEQTSIEMMAASVSAKDPSNWFAGFTINRGEKDGIKKNQAVVNANRELIGQILEVSSNFAEVITILDSDSSIGAEIKRSSEIGIIEGDANLRYSGMCRLGYIPRDTDIRPGDFVETSGLGGVFPKGLLIGTVVEIYDENSTMSKAATIEPLADISKVNEVFVITSYNTADVTEDIGGEDNSDNEDTDE